jgi:ATP-binding cassette subfamily B protein
MIETKTHGRRRQIADLFGFLGPRRFAYIASLFLLAAGRAGERMFIAYVVKDFVDAIVGADLNLLEHAVLAWALFLAAWIPVNVLTSYWWRSTTYRAMADLRQSVFAHLQRLPMSYHEGRHSGDLLSVLTNDVAVAEQAFQEHLLTLVSAVLQGISAVMFMSILSWPLMLLIVASGFIPLAANTLFAGPLRRAADAIQAHLGAVSERLADLLAGFQVVKSYSLGDWVLARFDRSNGELLGAGLRRVRLDAALSATNALGGVILMLLPIGIGSYMVFRGQTTFGTLVAMIQLSGPLQFLVYSLGGTISRLQSGLAAAARITAALREAPEPPAYGVPAPPPQFAKASPAPVVCFDAVRFGYGEELILRDVSFAVEAGQVAAFVGPSGGGKSTLFKLLLGCYPVEGGAIAVQGTPLNSLRLSDLRAGLAYIPQDAYLYTGTIMENIRYGRPDASDQAVMDAARAAYAHDFVTAFPDGYDTLVGERGARLSGGQRQRIAVARALLKDAPILLLDEATSALDSKSEELVQRALEALMRGRTVLVIAHRLSTIDNADIVYVIDEGRVAEQGTPHALLAQPGLFQRLYQLQFGNGATVGG